MNLFYTIIRAIFFYIPVRIIFPTKVFNKRLLPKERRVIVVSNHLSWKDIFLICIYIPKYRHIVAKKEFSKNPFLRFFGRLLGVIFVDRHKADLSAIRKGVNVLKKNHGLTLFPEGTRNKVDTSIQAVKNGVVMFSVKGEAPIVPVMIYSKPKAFRRSYLYVGEPFKFDSFEGKPLNSEALKLGSDIVEEKLNAAMTELKTAVSELNAKKKRKNKKTISQTENIESCKDTNNLENINNSEKSEKTEAIKVAEGDDSCKETE